MGAASFARRSECGVECNKPVCPAAGTQRGDSLFEQV
jgi:hypothetical protein